MRVLSAAVAAPPELSGYHTPPRPFRRRNEFRAGQTMGISPPGLTPPPSGVPQSRVATEAG
jgi:hypothetical protein